MLKNVAYTVWLYLTNIVSVNNMFIWQTNIWLMLKFLPPDTIHPSNGKAISIHHEDRN
jgi:hypothetical protein